MKISQPQCNHAFLKAGIMKKEHEVIPRKYLTFCKFTNEAKSNQFSLVYM